jgi:hypothetical protein
MLSICRYLKHVAEKNCIYSNANNSRSIQRNQKLFGERKEYLFSFHLNVLSMKSDVSPQRYRGLSLGIEIFFAFPPEIFFNFSTSKNSILLQTILPGTL